MAAGGGCRTSALYRERYGILSRLLLFKPLFAEALNLAAVYGFAVRRENKRDKFSGEASEL